MCSFHNKCSLTIAPRCFIDDTFSTLHPLKVKKRLTGGVFELSVSKQYVFGLVRIWKKFIGN